MQDEPNRTLDVTTLLIGAVTVRPGAVRFRPHLIDRESGVGVQILAADVSGDGLVDVVTASKLGTFVFRQRSSSSKLR